MALTRVDEAIQEIRRGRPVILVDRTRFRSALVDRSHLSLPEHANRFMTNRCFGNTKVTRRCARETGNWSASTNIHGSCTILLRIEPS